LVDNETATKSPTFYTAIRYATLKNKITIMIYSKFTFILILAIGLNSCILIYDSHKLRFPTNDFQLDNKTLKTNGYYFDLDSVYTGIYDFETNRMTNSKYYEKIITPILFYNNGYIKINGSYSGIMVDDNSGLKRVNTFENCHKNIKYSLLKHNNTRCKNRKSDVWGWGVFKIDKDSIKIQFYRNVLGDYYLTEYHGLVINDTTIIFKQQIDFKGYQDMDAKSINKLYRFCKFDKPDSINYLMINKERLEK
jgi:hypothetical protein